MLAFFGKNINIKVLKILMEVILDMSNNVNKECPCPNVSCSRHGDCEACIAAHKAHGSKTKCGKG